MNLKFINRLEIISLGSNDAGDYTCKVKNEYGDLEKQVTVAIDKTDSTSDENLIKKEMNSIFRKQIKIFAMLAR